MPIDEMDNTSVDVEDVADGSQDNTGDQDSDFLVVNERTRFRTAEDAIKSFDEAGKRIQSLSGWEKEIKDRFGVNDPQTAAALLQELVERRAEAERTAAAAKSQKTTATTVKTDDEEGLSTEDAQALKWLKKHAPRLGFVPQEELKSTVEELKAQIEELKTGNTAASQQVFESQRNSLIDSGRESVKGWMTTEKIADTDGEKQLVIESLVRDWVNSDQERVKRFYASSSESRALLKEGFDKAIKVLGWKTTGAGSTNTSTSHAINKGAALARNSKRMPQNGQGSRAQNNSGKPQTRVDAGGKKDYIGSAHNDAWDIAQRHFSGHSAE
jgi:hypothetical protein